MQEAQALLAATVRDPRSLVEPPHVYASGAKTSPAATGRFAVDRERVRATDGADEREFRDSTPHRFRPILRLAPMRKLKPYWVVVRDSDGHESQYLFDAPSRRRARADARRWASGASWNPTVVAITPGVRHPDARRLLAVAGITVVVSSTAIFAAMFIGLSLEGAL
jgi:hypothetical protein